MSEGKRRRSSESGRENKRRCSDNSNEENSFEKEKEKQAKGIVADTVEQNVEILEEEKKLEKLLELVSGWYEKGSILVFVNRQESADHLWREILKSGYQCLVIHGGKDQLEREFAIKDFKDGKTRLLVATSVAARGLDVPHLRFVVNYNVPNYLEDYAHRVGRTGRAGNQGTAWTFITPTEDMYAKDVQIALVASGKPVPEPLQKMVEEYELKRKQGLVKKRKLATVQDMKLQRTTYGVIMEDDDEYELKKAVMETKTNETKSDEEVVALVNTVVVENEQNKPAVRETKKMLGHVGASDSVQEEALKQILGNIDNKAQKRFREELEINDYPQVSRWKVTHKDALANITEMTGCDITVKGQHYLSGRNASHGNKKLYLLIEGYSLKEVRDAKTEIKRILDDATMRILDDATKHD